MVEKLTKDFSTLLRIWTWTLIIFCGEGLHILRQRCFNTS